MRKFMLLFCCIVVMAEPLTAATCVITEAAGSQRNVFIDNHDGTVTHTKSGLQWKRCSEGQLWDGNSCKGDAVPFTWQAALQQAQAMNSSGGFASFSNWRLPNIKELASIVERQCVNPAINEAIFPGTPTSSMYWSSSPYAGSLTHASGVGFDLGFDAAADKNSMFFVRFVRGEQ